MTTLTESDRQFLEKAMLCLKTAPELDTAKLAELLGIKPKSVTNRWAEVKKKIGLSGTPGPATPGRKRKGAANGEDEPETSPLAKKTKAAAERSASKKTKATKSRAARTQAEENESGEEENDDDHDSDN